MCTTVLHLDEEVTVRNKENSCAHYKTAVSPLVVWTRENTLCANATACAKGKKPQDCFKSTAPLRQTCTQNPNLNWLMRRRSRFSAWNRHPVNQLPLSQHNTIQATNSSSDTNSLLTHFGGHNTKKSHRPTARQEPMHPRATIIILVKVKSS